MTADRLLVGVDDAAAMLTVSRRTLQGLIYDGSLPSVKVGRSRRIAVADLEAFVDTLRHEQGDGPVK